MKDFYKNVGKRLKELRQDSKFTQEYVANFIHVTQGAYSKYELGQRPIPLEAASRLADLYNISLDYIAFKMD